MPERETRRPSLIIISGAPGSGKSTLARELSRELGFSVISKDVIKEALHDALPGQHTSAELSDAAMEVLWAMARDQQQAILDANFHPGRSLDRVCAIPGRKLEIHCVCPWEICAERYHGRSASPGHHPVHPKAISRESLEKYAGAIAACPVIEVRTDQPLQTGNLLAKIREHWPDI